MRRAVRPGHLSAACSYGNMLEVHTHLVGVVQLSQQLPPAGTKRQLDTADPLTDLPSISRKCRLARANAEHWGACRLAQQAGAHMKAGDPQPAISSSLASSSVLEYCGAGGGPGTADQGLCKQPTVVHGMPHGGNRCHAACFLSLTCSGSTNRPWAEPLSRELRARDPLPPPPPPLLLFLGELQAGRLL